MKPLTAEEIAELRKLWTTPTGVWNVLDAMACLAAVVPMLPRLLDEVDRLRSIEGNQRIVAKDIVAAEADLERARALLKRIEWEGWATGTEGLCPECLGHGTHKPDCELDALVNPR